MPPGRGEERRLDIFELRGSCRVEGIDEAPLLGLARTVCAIARERLVGKRIGPRHQFARNSAFGATLADPVLHACDLARIPAVEKVAENTAMPAELAIIIR
jgi:hypothetical protein